MLLVIHTGNFYYGKTTNERFAGKAELSKTVINLSKLPPSSRCYNFCCVRDINTQSFLMANPESLRESFRATSQEGVED